MLINCKQNKIAVDIIIHWNYKKIITKIWEDNTMKKTIVTGMLILALGATMAMPVSAGTKTGEAFTLRSYFSNYVETVNVAPRSIATPYYSLKVGTDTVLPKSYSGRLTENKELKSGKGAFGLTWKYAQMGYVTGKVDGVQINITDY